MYETWDSPAVRIFRGNGQYKRGEFYVEGLTQTSEVCMEAPWLKVNKKDFGSLLPSKKNFGSLFNSLMTRIRNCRLPKFVRLIRAL